MLKMKPKGKAKIALEQINAGVESKLWELGLSANSTFQILAINRENVEIKADQKKYKIPISLAQKINVSV